MINIIKSKSNEKIKEIKKLQTIKFQKIEKSFIVEGEHLLEEALKNGCARQIITSNVDYSNNEIDVIYVSEEIIKYLSNYSSNSKYLCVCDYLNNEIDENEDVIFLDNIQDPGNVGTILRNALAFNYQNIILSDDCASQYNFKTIQASQGALFNLNIKVMKVSEIVDYLKDNDYHLIATTLVDSKKMEDVVVSKKKALIFGNEGQGIKNEVLEKADEKIKIDINNIDSINVASAAAITMYYFSKIS